VKESVIVCNAEHSLQEMKKPGEESASPQSFKVCVWLKSEVALAFAYPPSELVAGI
jgi:hypothetical protein